MLFPVLKDVDHGYLAFSQSQKQNQSNFNKEITSSVSITLNHQSCDFDHGEETKNLNKT